MGVRVKIGFHIEAKTARSTLETDFRTHKSFQRQKIPGGKKGELWTPRREVGRSNPRPPPLVLGGGG